MAGWSYHYLVIQFVEWGILGVSRSHSAAGIAHLLVRLLRGDYWASEA